MQTYFVCKLDACKGACCWEGDMGAPLEPEEVIQLQAEYKNIMPFITEAGKAVIADVGISTVYKQDKSVGTPLINGGPCVYMTKEADGSARCGIEQAWKAGATTMQKPISCHLYPVRTEKHDTFEAVNYDEWDICSAACSFGKSLKLPLYVFVKDALIRKYGEAFYHELDQAAKHLQQEE